MVDEEFAPETESSGKFAVPVRDILANLIRSRKVLAAALLAPLSLSLIVAALLPPEWRSEAHLLVLPAHQYAERSLGQDVSAGVASETIAKIEIEILSSRGLARQVAAALGPHRFDTGFPAAVTSGPAYEAALDRAAEALSGALSIEPVVDSSVIHVRMSSRDPAISHDALSELIKVYIGRRPSIFEENRVAFLERKRDEAALDVERARRALAEYGAARKIVSLRTQIALELEQESKLSLASMQAEQIAAEKRATGSTLKTTSSKLPQKVLLTQDQSIESESGNSRAILLGLQLRRQELLSKYAETSHFITDLDQQIAALKSFESTNKPRTGQAIGTGINPVLEQVSGDLRTSEQEQAGNEARSLESGRQAEAARDRLYQLMDDAPEYGRLERAVALAESRQKMLTRFIDEARLAHAMGQEEAANVRVTLFSEPERHSGADRKLVAGAGLLIGFVAAAFTAFLFPAFRETMLTPSSAARRLGLPALAVVDDGKAAIRPRRVLIIVENLPVPFDRRVWNEARTLAGAGYEVSVICPAMRPHLQRREVIDGIHIYRHWMPHEADGLFGYALEYGVAFTMQLWLATRIFVTCGFDVIHACNPPDLIFLVALPFKVLFGRRFVFDHHDLNPELYEAKFGRRGVGYRLLCLLEGWTFRLADLSIATNESYRRVAIDRGGKRPGQVHVVRSGPDLKRFHLVNPDPSLLDGRRHLVAYVGTMGKQEGIQYLLDAARQIRDRHGRTDVLYRLAGGGTEIRYLQEMAKGFGLEKDVIFEGRVSDERLAAILATASLCVNPDEANELNDKSTMNKIMEYMAAGKAIVQFDLTEGRVSAGEASDYARPNDSADLADRIVALLDDPDRRARMGAYGRKRVSERLAWEHEAPKLLAAYERVFSPR